MPGPAIRLPSRLNNYNNNQRQFYAKNHSLLSTQMPDYVLLQCHAQTIQLAALSAPL